MPKLSIYKKGRMRMEKLKRGFGKSCFVFGILLFIFVIVMILHPRIMIQPVGIVFFLLLEIILLLLGEMGISTDTEKSTIFLKVRIGIIFLFYLIVVYQCVFGDSIFNRNHDISSVNVIPFNTILKYIVAWNNDEIVKSVIIYNILGNLILLMPLGFFVPYYFKKFQTYIYCFFAWLFCSMAIEVFQYIFRVGSFDIDDVILNISGASILYFALRISVVKKILRKCRIDF